MILAADLDLARELDRHRVDDVFLVPHHILQRTLGQLAGPIENASRAASTEAIMKLLNGAAFNVPSSFSVDTNAIGRGMIEEVNSR